ncbi:MATE family efflux transporter [Succinatimonas hippei]|uniref:MATE family efflux transporter n=1 Tax=Succinatimonas hippei TaxID=626938 RepID=UPI002010C827|nr:MATE family efflux transporter [Succinatimonas hippei]MCL1603810.1 MATE family efflux transporter [Succinatimonas hippei]
MSEVRTGTEVVPTLPKEIHRIIKLAWPIIFGQLASTSMTVVDTVMAGAAGTEQLSGVAIGGSFYWPAILAIVGLSFALQPIVAQLRGAGKADEIPARVQLAAIICLTVSLLMAVVLCFTHFLYKLMPNVNAEMVRVATGYLYALACSFPAIAIYNVMRAYCEGLGKTLPTLIFGFVMLAAHIPLNYIFIFGKFGMPALGGIGCGVASTISIYIATIALFIYVQKSRHYRRFRIFRQFYEVKKQDIFNFLRLGFPLAISTTIEVACFSLVSFLLSPFGPNMVAGHSIALNVSGILFIVPLSIASAATIRTGEAMGARHWNRAQRTATGVYTIDIFVLLCFISIILIFGDYIISLYTSDQEVTAIASTLLTFLLIYQLPDTVQAISIGILRGFKDSRTIFIVTFIAYWIVGMPLGICLAYGYIGDKEFAAMGFWIGFTAGLSTAAIFYIFRITYLFKKRVIPKGMKLKI